MAAETDDAFRQLDDAELAALWPLGVRRAVSAGEYLYREGDPGYDFYVVLSGTVGIVVNPDGKERVIASHSPGRFLGELNLRPVSVCSCRLESRSPAKCWPFRVRR